MRELLSESEKMYIKEKILDPMKPDMEKSLLFGTTTRAEIMLEGSLKKLKFEKDYEARVFFDKRTEKNIILRLQAKRKDCDEVISLDFPLSLK